MVHQKLINLRKKKGLTQKEFAAKIAMEQTTYSRKERGQTKITNEEWLRFAEVLNVPLKEIQDDKVGYIKEVKSLENENYLASDDIDFLKNTLKVMLKYTNKLEVEVKELKTLVANESKEQVDSIQSFDISAN